MAGAGYKLFNTGDVLTAAQVNTYLQEQVVMVFADAAARTTALSGVLAEGMVSYLKSTKVVEIYNGTAWASLDDPNAIQNTIVDAKGDLIAASGNDVPTRLAVGNNGDSLVVDSGTATGLRWQANFAAGKNAILNGDFRINQRNFSSTTTAGYGFDRWSYTVVGGTATMSAQTFTAGSAPVSGYEAINFVRIATTGQTTQSQYTFFEQKIEDVRAFAGQTITLSFWAKASSGTPFMWLEYGQNFGSGGSASVEGQIGATQTLSTSWTRYSVTATIPSISGKTIGTSSSLRILFWTSVGSSIRGYSSATFQNATIDIWGVQVEPGSVATAFETATGTLAGELAACQRYYYRIGGSAYSNFGTGYVTSTTNIRYMVQAPVTMRVTPTALDSSAANTFNPIDSANGSYTPTAITFNSTESDPRTQAYDATGSGLTAGRYTYNRAGNTTAAYIGFSAEL